MEAYCEHLYNRILNELVIPLVGKNVTYSDQLNDIGKKLLNEKFSGIYSCNNIPLLTRTKKYAIVNVDNSNQPGSHWVAVCKINGKTYHYDSFARDNKKLMPSLSKSGNGKIVNVDISDAEQKVIEDSCGARCIAFLLFVDAYGMKYGKYI